MARHNTGSDSANTAVRAFLTKVGEFYLGDRSTRVKFDTGTVKGKMIWERIRDEVFLKKCAYCEIENAKLETEHLIMMNREQFGLHHPGNIVPVCSRCNIRKAVNKKYPNWEEHLKLICDGKGEISKFKNRKKKIKEHIKKEKYPELSKEEKHAIRVIAESLYANTKSELNKSIELYEKLDEAFVSKK